MPKYRVFTEIQYDNDEEWTVEQELVEALDSEAACRAAEFIWSDVYGVSLLGEVWAEEV